jgi:hypothetical protein
VPICLASSRAIFDIDIGATKLKGRDANPIANANEFAFQLED